jgi:hypothetical protein
MGGLFGGGQTKSNGADQTTAASTTGPFPDDNVTRAPVFNSPSTRAAERKTRDRIRGRSGRDSTRLARRSPGRQSFTNSFLGSVG